MATLSDSSIHEDEHDIVAEYENRGSDGDQQGYGSGNENMSNEENEGEESKPRRIDPSTSKKHIVRNPIPKLNTERLKGPKGIHTIEKYFEGFKFHGKGHEKADLDRVMKRLEHWAHRLFPKLDYDDFLGRVEVLGTKKDLQVFIKKYRMDMVTADEDLISKDIIEDEVEKEDNAPIDEFDMLIAEQIEKQKQAVVQQESINENRASTSFNETAFNQLLANTNSQNSQPVKESNTPSELTDEIKARIERNRQQAIQRRLARLKQIEEEAKRKKLEETSSTELSQEKVESGVSEKEAEESNDANNGDLNNGLQGVQESQNINADD